MTTLHEPPDENLQLDLLAQPPAGWDEGATRADENAEPDWREMALREIEALARSGFEFTCDDVRARVGEPDHANRWGGLFLSARRAGLIELVMVRPSATPSRHAGLVRVWRGTGRAA